MGLGASITHRIPGTLQGYSKHGANRELQTIHAEEASWVTEEESPGCSQNHTSPGLTQGGSGICNCIKLPGNFVVAH